MRTRSARRILRAGRRGSLSTSRKPQSTVGAKHSRESPLVFDRFPANASPLQTATNYKRPLLQDVLQPAAAAGMPQLLHGAGLDLAYALACYAHGETHFLQRARRAIRQAIPQHHHLAL